MRSDSRHQHHACTRHDDGTAVGERVSRRSCWRRHNESVGLVGRQIVAVDAGTYRDHRCSISLQDGHIVEGTGIVVDGFAIGLHTYHSTALHRIVALQERIHRLLDIAGTDIGQESQSAHVHTEYRYLLLAHLTGCLQQCTVASHRDSEVGFELAARERLGIGDVDKLRAGQEIIVLLLYQDARTTFLQAGEHLSHGCRFLVLVDIAEEGKGKGR